MVDISRSLGHVFNEGNYLAGVTGVGAVYLVVRAGFDSLCIDLVEGEFPIRIMAYDIGDRRPLGVGAGSLALMAFLPLNETEAILKANRNRYADYDGLSVEKVRQMVDISRSLGHVFNEGNYLAGVTGVGEANAWTRKGPPKLRP